MKTLLVSGNDTGVGKTWVVASLARSLSQSSASVQVVKPVETGVRADEPGDAQQAVHGCVDNVSAHRFLAFPEPMAPVDAAHRAGQALGLHALGTAVNGLPVCDYRILEGAGGLAVPLEDSGADWRDLARMLAVDVLVLVVEDRLGAIAQARMLVEYAQRASLNAVLWLNQCQPCEPFVRQSNRRALARLAYPLVAVQDAGASEPEWILPLKNWMEDVSKK